MKKPGPGTVRAFLFCARHGRTSGFSYICGAAVLCFPATMVGQPSVDFGSRPSNQIFWGGTVINNRRLIGLVMCGLYSMAASAQTSWPAIMPRLKPALSESPVAAVLPVGGVSVPPTSALPAEMQRWFGQWSGWACLGRQCDVRIAIESLAAHQATVAFAMANALQGQLAERAIGVFDNDELIVSLSGKRVVLRLRTDGDMEMSFWKPESQLMSVGVLTQRELQSPYTRTIERLPTPWKDGDKPQTLEMVVYRPLGTGPFPTLVFNHGSTGGGNRPDWFKLTWTSPEVAEYFARKGWQVLFPQRRGRGLSDGLYDEGFAPDRAMGYSCEPKYALSGFDRATEDLDIVMAQVLARSDVDAKRLLIGGVSRGGFFRSLMQVCTPNYFKVC